MAYEYCTSGAAIIMAGANANSTIIANGSALLDIYNNAHSTINSAIRKDYTTLYSTLSSNVKNILTETASKLMATDIINYDMSGYTSRAEAQTMLDVLRDAILRNIAFLRDKKTQTFINDA